MDFYSVLLPLAIILALSKVLVKLCERIHIPAVVGMLAAGVLIGLIEFIPGQTVLTDTSLEGVGFLAKIGVILIMFSAGLETDFRQIEQVGFPSVVITLAGVLVPLGLGFLAAVVCNGHLAGASPKELTQDLFYGVILTATSVSVTVAALKELGKLTGRLGSTIVTAALLDDIIGVIVLSLVISLSSSSPQDGSTLLVLIKTALFFIFAIAAGLVLSKLFAAIERRWPHHRLLPILSISMCFFFAYASEAWFGIADITGAFAAGLMLSRNPEKGYIDRRSDIMGYMIFTPVFFANIGITTKFSAIDPSMLTFGALFILAGIFGKLLGCSLTAFACGYSKKDSLRVGLGMMVRAEVALVCAQKGVERGIIDTSVMPFIVALIIITSFLTPVLLRLSYRKEKATEEQTQ